MARKYLPTMAELVDRLSILQLKEIFIPEYKAEYAKEIQDVLHDIDDILNSAGSHLAGYINANTIRDIIVLAQMNLHIWHNEANYRKGIKEGNNLELTHTLNGVRNRAKNRIQDLVGGRKDYKTDCLANEHSAWEPSW